MMNFLIRDAIIPAPLFQATTRDDAIRELVGSLFKAGILAETDQADIVRAILRREQLGTTGIGRNIAIPHSRHAAVTQLTGTLAVSGPGVGFDSVDGEPVHVMILLISPPDKPGEHLRSLENVVTTLRDEALVKAIREAKTKDEIWAVLQGHAPGGRA
ncbi:PTS sugar transporter subunit IIA [Limnoglobus roseus]|uniref:Fructose-specific EIIABC component of PTS system n=1 Tax=Limnoglobus roseus TaxID=2598579 RepID=A0A5C1AAN8_9BACT|nr:PTS sugar transporter subunit IIA [Limnoglobus roseus]QEL14882.1 fructose-specific EIIABC component of PTS system [Limnoglobus roseus]